MAGRAADPLDAVGGRVLFVFLDGVGIGPSDPDRNPFLQARLPTLTRLIGHLPTLDRPSEAAGAPARVVPLDATLGVAGTPQSGTGQTALLTGHNAPALYGRHFGPWTPVKLRPLLASENLLSVALRAGRRVVFANAYPAGFAAAHGGKRLAPSPLAALSAGLMTRGVEELASGEAVASEITNGGWRSRLGHTNLPRVTPEEAGENLGRLAGGAHLTYFAHYSTDHAGHRGGMAGAIRALERVDRFLDGVLRAVPEDTALVVASDHGNIEEVGEEHTRNPVLGCVHGGADPSMLDGASSIADVAGAVLRQIGVERPESDLASFGELI